MAHRYCAARERPPAKKHPQRAALAKAVRFHAGGEAMPASHRRRTGGLRCLFFWPTRVTLQWVSFFFGHLLGAFYHRATDQLSPTATGRMANSGRAARKSTAATSQEQSRKRPTRSGSRAPLGARGHIPERDKTQLNAVSLCLFV